MTIWFKSPRMAECGLKYGAYGNFFIVNMLYAEAYRKKQTERKYNLLLFDYK